MKNTFSKKILSVKAIATIVLLSATSIMNAQSASNWKLESEKNGVKLLSKAELCKGVNSLLLKFENTTTTNKHVGCHIIIESPEQNMPLLPKFIELKANETKEGSCDTNKELVTDIKTISNPKLRLILTVN